MDLTDTDSKTSTEESQSSSLQDENDEDADKDSSSSSSSSSSSASSSQSSIKHKPPRPGPRRLKRNGVQSDVTQRLFQTRNSLINVQHQRNAQSLTSYTQRKGGTSNSSSRPPRPPAQSRPHHNTRSYQSSTQQHSSRSHQPSTSEVSRIHQPSQRAKVEAGVVFRLARRGAKLTPPQTTPINNKILPKITYSHRSDLNKDLNKNNSAWLQHRTQVSSSDSSSSDSDQSETEEGEEKWYTAEMKGTGSWLWV